MDELKETTCAYCDAPAVGRCGFILGQNITGYTRIGPIAAEGVFEPRVDEEADYFCELPVCEQHGHRSDTAFRLGPAGPVHFPTYRCAEHEGVEMDVVPMTQEEAEMLRREVRILARRSRLKLV